MEKQHRSKPILGNVSDLKLLLEAKVKYTREVDGIPEPCIDLGFQANDIVTHDVQWGPQHIVVSSEDLEEGYTKLVLELIMPKSGTLENLPDLNKPFKLIKIGHIISEYSETICLPQMKKGAD